MCRWPWGRSNFTFPALALSLGEVLCGDFLFGGNVAIKTNERALNLSRKIQSQILKEEWRIKNDDGNSVAFDVTAGRIKHGIDRGQGETSDKKPQGGEISSISCASVLLLPTLPFAAPRHNVLLLKAFNTSYTSIWNCLEIPAMHVPCKDVIGGTLPTGFSIVGSSDSVCLSVAAFLEAGGLVGAPTNLFDADRLEKDNIMQ